MIKEFYVNHCTYCGRLILIKPYDDSIDEYIKSLGYKKCSGKLAHKYCLLRAIEKGEE